MGMWRRGAALAAAVATVWSIPAQAAPLAPGELRAVAGQCAPLTSQICVPHGVLAPDGVDIFTDQFRVLAYHRHAGATLPTPVTGPFGCVGTTFDHRACLQLDPAGEFPQPATPKNAMLSPDGRFVYIATDGADQLYAFARERGTGKLRPLRETGACITADRPTVRCSHVTALPQAVLASVGATLIVTGGRRSPNAWGIVRRDPATGRLSQRPGSCVAEPGGVTPCGPSPLPDLLRVFEVGGSVYAVGTSRRLQLLQQTAAGRWVAATGPGSCVAVASAGCVALGGSGFPTYVPSPDGRHIYAFQAIPTRIDIFARNATTGRLSATGICYGVAPCQVGPEAPVSPMFPPTFSGDGRILVLDGTGIPTVRRDPVTGALTLAGGSLPCFASTICTTFNELQLSQDGTVGFANGDSSRFLAMARPPSCDTTTRHTRPGAALVLAFGCADINGEPFTVSLATPPAHGTFALNGPASGGTYTPVSGFVGADVVRLHLSGSPSTDVAIPVAVAASSATTVTGIETPDPFFTASRTRGVPRVAVIFKDPVILTARVVHGGKPVAGATVRGVGWGGAVTVTSDELGGVDAVVPARQNHRITFSALTGVRGTPGRVDLDVSPDMLLDASYRLVKAKIRFGGKLVADAPVRLGRVDLQKRVRGKWRTVQRLKIDRRNHFLGSIPKRQYRGPWRFLYVHRRAPYFDIFTTFKLAKPRADRGARAQLTGQIIPGRRGH